MDKCAIAWPEDPAPPGVSCAEFGLTGHGRLVWGEGNPRGRLMIVLDNPGARETSAGAPFTCGTRMTLTRAAVAARLDLADIYVTYLVKCRPRRKYDRLVAYDIGRRYLKMQIVERQPSVLVLLGEVVAQAVTDADAASVRALRGSSLTVHGVPAVVSYHPLAARRRPNLYPALVDDLTRAGRLLPA